MTEALQLVLLDVAAEASDDAIRGRRIDAWIRAGIRHGYEEILIITNSPTGTDAHEKAEGVAISWLRAPSAALDAGALQSAFDRLHQEFMVVESTRPHCANLLALVDDANASVDALALAAIDDGTNESPLGLSMDEFAVNPERARSLEPRVVRLQRDALLVIKHPSASLTNDVWPSLARQGQLHARRAGGSIIDPTARRPIALLDRDGVLNKDIIYAHRPDQIEWVSGAKEAVRHLNDAGYFVAVVTNQSGIARGLYTEEDVRSLHRFMQGELRRAGAHVDSFHYCPHHPSEGIEPYVRDCHCRKPKPGLLTDAIARWPVEMDGSFLIGDRERDILAGVAAGVPGHLYDGSIPLDAFVRRITG
jgi:D-glycero-D-manno-heptose 1,7-bisphosphate phosphatase